MNSQEQKRLLMDLDINMRTVDCFYTVTFYGALFREVRASLCLCPTLASHCCSATLVVCREASHTELPATGGRLGSRASLFLANSVPQFPCLKMKQVFEQVSLGCGQGPGLGPGTR